MHTTVEIDGKKICTWPAFHDVFAAKLGFPSFYGRNMDAWIDCMTSLDDSADGMSTVHAPDGGVLVLSIQNVDHLIKRGRKIYDALIECSAFVNHRKMEVGERPVLALSFCRR
tara:strand:- start:678 stop:1016 length:339 start_codon:yes stop_codon:yes gene_type:complete